MFFGIRNDSENDWRREGEGEGEGERGRDGREGGMDWVDWVCVWGGGEERGTWSRTSVT